MDDLGVAAWINETAEIFYCSVFSTKYLGRVTDTFLKEMKVDLRAGLKFRKVLLNLAGLAFVHRSKEKKGIPMIGQEQPVLQLDPILLECGADENNICLAVGFRVNPSRSLEIKGLADRISNGSAHTELERHLRELFLLGDHLIVKVTQAGRIVAINMVMATGKAPSEIQPKVEIQVVHPSGNPLVTDAAFYTYLGDVEEDMSQESQQIIVNRLEKEKKTRVSTVKKWVHQALHFEGRNQGVRVQQDPVRQSDSHREKVAFLERKLSDQKTKLTLFQKLYTLEKLRNQEFLRKLDTRNHALEEQEASSADYKTLAAQYDILFRQTEEFKVVNRRLVELVQDLRARVGEAISKQDPDESS